MTRYIYGVPYRVYFKDLSKEHLDGYCDIENKEIYIHKDLPDKEKALVLLHEEGHALWDRLGLNRLSISGDVQELIVEAYAVYIHEAYNIKPKEK